MAGRRRSLILMTDCFDELNDSQFRREWVAELLDQICMGDGEELSIHQLAKALTDVRTRYEMMMQRMMQPVPTRPGQRDSLNDVQMRVIRRLKGVITQKEIAAAFKTSQTRVSQIHRNGH